MRSPEPSVLHSLRSRSYGVIVYNTENARMGKKYDRKDMDILTFSRGGGIIVNAFNNDRILASTPAGSGCP